MLEKRPTEKVVELLDAAVYQNIETNGQLTSFVDSYLANVSNWVRSHLPEIMDEVSGGKYGVNGK